MHVKRLAIVSLALVLGLVAAGCAQKSGPGGGKEQTGAAQQQQEATAPGGGAQGAKDSGMDMGGKDSSMDMAGKDGGMDMGGGKDMQGMGGMGGMAGHNERTYDVPPDAPKIEVSMKNVRFNPAEFRLKAGEPVRFAVGNDDTVAHDFMLDGENGFDTGVLQPGDKKEIGWIPEKPGTYEAYCSQPGHKDLGMTAKIVVE